jgi:hypothetical protein
MPQKFRSNSFGRLENSVIGCWFWCYLDKTGATSRANAAHFGDVFNPHTGVRRYIRSIHLCPASGFMKAPPMRAVVSAATAGHYFRQTFYTDWRSQ